MEISEDTKYKIFTYGVLLTLYSVSLALLLYDAYLLYLIYKTPFSHIEEGLWGMSKVAGIIILSTIISWAGQLWENMFLD